MEVFEHGGYLVLDGTRGSLEHVAELLEQAEEDDSDEVAGKIRRGLERGATRIAVERPRFGCVERSLDLADDELGRTLKEDVDQALQRLETDDLEVGEGGDVDDA